jgi:serine/threonine protein phosphatase PrpC
LIIEAAGITHIGRKRRGNEDALLLDDNLRLYVVADGMGGHLAGDVASHLAVESLRNHMSGLIAKEVGMETGEYDTALSDEANLLVWSIERANREVYKLSLTDPSYRGMGSTVSAIYITSGGDRLVAANVGDSPIWLLHNGGIETLSVSHTVMAECAALGLSGCSHAPEYKHVLTRAVGIAERVKADVCEFQCFDDDVIVISSDGLSDKVSANEILEIVTGESPEVACQALVDLANDRGGDDNITVTVIKLKAINHGKRGAGSLFSQIGWKLRNLWTSSKKRQH